MEFLLGTKSWKRILLNSALKTFLILLVVKDEFLLIEKIKRSIFASALNGGCSSAG
ncbi:hypothetical protein [Flagellimonas sp.]|uniref:hypothetical protein n=1 Tax=Flagellimonas sp. TaxID=2058762 RepID=UPI003BB1ED55